MKLKDLNHLKRMRKTSGWGTRNRTWVHRTKIPNHPKRLILTECHRVAYFLDLEQFLCSRCVIECDRDRSRIGSKTGSEPGVKPGSGETPTFLLPTRSPFPTRTLTDLPLKNRSPRYVIWTHSPTSPSFDENLFLPNGGVS